MTSLTMLPRHRTPFRFRLWDHRLSRVSAPVTWTVDFDRETELILDVLAISFTTFPTWRNVPAPGGDGQWRGVLAGRSRTVASTPTIPDRTTTPL